jgi:hypothetical protein
MTARFCLLALLLSLVVPRPVQSCNVPVFRFALESWEASRYEVLVFHRGPLGDDARALVRKLTEPPRPANVTAVTVDLALELEDDIADLWKAQGRETALPWVVVRYPDAGEKMPPAWTGPLTEENVAPLLDSPIRRHLFGRLTCGDSAVFLLLESGDQAADRAALTLLEKVLLPLQDEIKLSEAAGSDPARRSALPLYVGFPILRLSPADPSEAVFIHMLRHSEEGLADVRGPIVYPIFGRGRALTGLHGKELTPQELRRVATFLCGDCSCKVKRLNPGMDLLVSGNWESVLTAAGPGDAPRLTLEANPRPAVIPQLVEEETPAEPASPAVPAQTPCAPWLWSATVAAGLLVLATGVWVICSRARREPSS